MNIHKKCGSAGILLGIVLMWIMCSRTVFGAESSGNVLFSLTEESQVTPISDQSGTYLLKGEGFYCLNEDGSRHAQEAVHYFDHVTIDGTVFHGYYYHDAEGKYRAGNGHIVVMKQIACREEIFDGIYMVQNLGKMSAAPQVHYLNDLTVEKNVFHGYYFFDEKGRLVTENGIHQVEMVCNGLSFSGSYYFGGPNGALLQEAGTTPEGFPVESDGKVTGLDELGMSHLQPRLETMLAGYEGTWSVYIQNLGTGEEILLNDQPLYSASLIKAFTLAASYQNMEQVLADEAAQKQLPAGSEAAREKLHGLLWNMIAVSDNESYNEVVRLQTPSNDFLEGAALINQFLAEQGYSQTTVQSTLQPSSSETVSLGGKNTTSVRDCGLLLERIFKGTCVSPEASLEMLNFFLEQECDWKIPEGVPEEIRVANKTGETDTSQHDIAIVYGPKITYILCVMSQDCPNGDVAVDHIREISRVVYNYLNL